MQCVLLKIQQKGGHRHNSDNESIQCERQKLWFLCPLIPTEFIELGKKDYGILPVALQLDHFPAHHQTRHCSCGSSEIYCIIFLNIIHCYLTWTPPPLWLRNMWMSLKGEGGGSAKTRGGSGQRLFSATSKNPFLYGNCTLDRLFCKEMICWPLCVI